MDCKDVMLSGLYQIDEDFYIEPFSQEKYDRILEVAFSGVLEE